MTERRARGGRPARGEPVLDRAFRLLGCFSPDRPTLSLAALSELAGLPKPTALRLARKLVELGALEQAESGDYTIGLRLLEIASLAPRGHGLRENALPYMEDLLHATGQHVLLSVREGVEAVLVERLSARGAHRVGYRVGGRMPLHSTGNGLILLAFAPKRVQEEVLAVDWSADEENLNGTGTELRARLAAVRRDRFAVSSRRKRGVSLTSVAAPVVDRRKNTIAAVSVITGSEQVAPATHIPAVIAVARAISRAAAL
ncbi:IclR family transcriptional regulator [Kutzneria albida]|uniref:Glycerol operon regulatory protein n=1 Tax=Kutzneria albida DSM 43870 TaxID=1449976 RepID=W5W7K6_9PSEU|nr:IclR family transcriptional regulator [Kutzneria albida]AHH96922.1 transcription regulator [Kutzneria albida DSM 43870]